MAGKLIDESKAARLRDCNGKGLTNTFTKPSDLKSNLSIVTDKSSGHAYLVDLTTNTVLGNIP